MTSTQIELVQQSWEAVKPIAKEAGAVFYGKLFNAAPQVRPLFKEDISEQAAKLVRMLSFVVSMLKRLGDIESDIEKLAASHNAYGAKPEHYAVVGQCLIETLSEGLGERWNAELEEAWLAVYAALQNAMIKAQNEHGHFKTLHAVKQGGTVSMGYL